MVSEMYFQLRVAKIILESRSRILAVGFALDLTTVDPDDGDAWDFTVASKRAKARALIRAQAPYVLIGSPMDFSAWQRLNRARSNDPEAMRRARVGSIVHLNFVAELYEEQIDVGRYFLYEHPLFADS